MAKDGWDKLKALGGFLAAVLIPVVVVVVGQGYNSAVEQAERQVRYIELATSILSEEPSPGQENLRDWAIKVINEYSEIKLGAEVQRQLRDSVKITVPGDISRAELMRQTRLDDELQFALNRNDTTMVKLLESIRSGQPRMRRP